MSEHFLRRWSRRKREAEQQAGHHEASNTNSPSTASRPGQQDRPPTMQDVARLARDADFSRFLSPHVDPGVRRAALKKLFSDPHFNRIDGLDIYMGDYTRAEPITAAMRAALSHVGDFLDERTDEADVGTASAPKRGAPGAEAPAQDPSEHPHPDPDSEARSTK